MNELDKKLAKWAGFTYDEDAEFVNGMWVDRSKWMSPDRIVFYGGPVFTDSLDLCFQYLVPKCGHVGLSTADKYFDASVWPKYPDSEYDGVMTMEAAPALALCKAIEKLIDAEGK